MTETIERPFDLGGPVIGLSPILKEVLALRRRSLAVALQGNIDNYAAGGTFTRMLSILLDAQTAEGHKENILSSRDLIVLVTKVSMTLNAVADQISLYQASDVLRAVKSMWEGEKLSAIIADTHPGSYNFSADALANLVYSVIMGAGTSNRLGAEIAMAELGQRMTRTSIGEVSYSKEVEAMDVAHLEYLVAAGLWADLESCLEAEITNDEPSRPLADDNRTRAVSERTSLLRRAGSTFMGLLIASHVRVGRALSVWLGSPLVQTAVAGTLLEKINRARSFCDERLSALASKHSPGWELFTANAFDLNLLNPMGVLEALPHGLVGGPSGPNLPLGDGKALLADVVYPVTITRAAVDAMLTMLYQVVEQGDDYYNTVRSDEGADVSPLRSPTSLTINTEAPSDYVLDIQELPGLPFVSSLDTTVRLPHSRFVLRELGLTEWVMHTATEIKDVLIADGTLDEVPVLIRGDGGTDLIPVVSRLNDVETMGTWAMQPEKSLLAALETTSIQLNEAIAGFSSINSLGLRMLADRLMFIGQLRTSEAEGKKVSASIIIPTCDHYYHGDQHDSNIEKEGIVLGVTATGHEIRFHRFLSIPDSVRVSGFEDNLHIYAKSDTVPAPKYSVRWFKEGEVGGTSLTITGWTRSSNPIIDIVTVPSYQPFSGCRLLMDKQGRLRGARCDNAVLRLGGSDTPWQPLVSSIESYINAL